MTKAYSNIVRFTPIFIDFLDLVLQFITIFIVVSFVILMIYGISIARTHMWNCRTVYMKQFTSYARKSKEFVDTLNGGSEWSLDPKDFMKYRKAIALMIFVRTNTTKQLRVYTKIVYSKYLKKIGSNNAINEMRNFSSEKERILEDSKKFFDEMFNFVMERYADSHIPYINGDAMYVPVDNLYHDYVIKDYAMKYNLTVIYDGGKK